MRKKEEMAKHVCDCGCGANNMSCMECPISSIFQPVLCKKTIATRKQQHEESNKRTWNEMKKKQIKRKNTKRNIFFYKIVLLFYFFQ